MAALQVWLTNIIVFGLAYPTDTMPLSARAKLRMNVRSVAALLTSLLVIARPVSVLH